MPIRRSALPRLLAALTVLLLTAMLTAGASQAASWGELGHFADKSGEVNEPEATLGVNPEDGSVWVVDNEGAKFRLQKFENSGGSWKVVASTTFKPKGTETEAEGVAFDPGLHRAYVLATQERSGNAGKIDPFDQAAADLYAFSSQTSTSKIEPATGTGEEGILATPTTLKPTSNVHGESLLAPGGITVNPTNHQILVTGFDDRGKLGTTEEETPAVWAISEKGEVASRWVDESGFFEECGCVNSPVVTSTGHIYVLSGEGEIDEIPSSLESKTAAKQVFKLPNAESCLEITCPWEEKLTKFPGEGGEEGAQMSIGTEGNIYVRDRIKLAAEKENQFGGVMVLTPALTEVGWIGGGTSASESGVCAVNELVERPKVAAGTEKVFMLQRTGAINKSKILELGPGGSGCPTATATEPTAKTGGIELTKFPITDKIAFSSKMTQANAVSTEWEFEPGVKETVGERQQETTLVEHTFAKEGPHTVVEKIHTDNLATPEIKKERTITILGPPKIVHEEAVVEGTSATLKAEVNPNLANTECHFEYGPASEPFGAGSTQVPCAKAPGEGETFVAESTKVTTGLEAGKQYHFRLVAKSESGKTEPEGTKFLIPAPNAPKAETLAATSVGSATATLNGKVNPEGTPTECKFLYGTTKAYGKEAPCATSPGNGKTSVPVSAAVSGLEANTVYHFVLVAENTAKVKGEGLDIELKTLEPGLAPTAETLAASSITQTGATLNGKVNPGGELTTCEFEYGTVLPSAERVAC